ncbi:MAG TPA: hypothetical protein VHB25_11635 [Gemmatimonadaceae bacterium]|nr:hypothetical protein [Gemmatimonadaceae bacterium]
MTWLLPSALVVGGVAALAAAAIHFITRSRPLAEPLPTARFIPHHAIRARVTAFGLSDLLLLLLRIAAIAAIAIGVAAPEFAGTRGRTARIIVVDRSRAVADPLAARDSARAFAGRGAVLIAFDSVARVVPSVDSTTSNARGSLSAGVAAALRAAAGMARRADSVELIVISAFTNEEMDAATARIRDVWPGRIRLVPLQPAATPRWAPGVQTSVDAGDVVRAGLALMGVVHDTGSVRLDRGHVSAADSAWARGAGHVLLHWPATGGDARWPARPTIDAIGGVSASSGATLVGRFPRAFAPPGAAIARWADGEIAVGESRLGAGCVRDVGILIDPASDLTLRPPFRAFAQSLLAPCGGARDLTPLDSAHRAALTGGGSLAATSALAIRADATSRWTPWLLLVGAVLLIVELAVRRSTGGAAR